MQGHWNLQFHALKLPFSRPRFKHPKKPQGCSFILRILINIVQKASSPGRSGVRGEAIRQPHTFMQVEEPQDGAVVEVPRKGGQGSLWARQGGAALLSPGLYHQPDNPFLLHLLRKTRQDEQNLLISCSTLGITFDVKYVPAWGWLQTSEGLWLPGHTCPCLGSWPRLALTLLPVSLPQTAELSSPQVTSPEAPRLLSAEGQKVCPASVALLLPL